jgi:hypothetical protein
VKDLLGGDDDEDEEDDLLGIKPVKAPPPYPGSEGNSYLLLLFQKFHVKLPHLR